MKNSDYAWACDSDLPPSARHVLMCLIRRADKRRKCFPSHRTISNDSGLSRNNIVRCIKILEDCGRISRIRRHRKNGTRTSDMYTIHAPRPQKAAVKEVILTVVGGTEA